MAPLCVLQLRDRRMNSCRASLLAGLSLLLSLAAASAGEFRTVAVPSPALGRDLNVSVYLPDASAPGPEPKIARPPVM